jgi:hypothetical protein
MPLTYDKTIRTRTITERMTTRHIDQIDWDYDFNNPKHTSCLCASAEYKAKQIEQHIAALRACESAFREGRICYIEQSGGFRNLVLGIGMVSSWPYWEPRPSVLVESTLGPEWKDWREIFYAYVEGKP